MITVRCISRKVTGQTEVALPQFYLGTFEDGEERALPDDLAENVLTSPCFEKVEPLAKALAPKPTAQSDAAPAPAAGGKS